MKQRILTAAAALLAALALAGCGATSDEARVAKALGVDTSGASLLSSSDTHGGFLGDGVSCVALAFPDDRLERQLAADPDWQPLPMDDTTRALVWGVEDGAGSVGPYLADGDGAPLVPPVENGFYRLIDRHSDQDTPLLERGSFNFTVGVYDAGANTLSCCELDT